jgi:dihydrofolate reductase
MTRFVYATATTLDGYLADPDHSLDWLFVVDGGEESLAEMDKFIQRVGVMVEGSSTYRWIVEHDNLLQHPEKWQEFHGDRPTYVFTSRTDLPVVPGADVRFVSGDVSEHLPAIRELAGDKDVWIVGGGDLVGQFVEVDALDEIHVSIAPVTLGAGAPLLPRVLDSTRLRLAEVSRAKQFVNAKYEVVPAVGAEDPRGG